MYELSPKAGELADAAAKALLILHHVVEAIPEIEDGQERAAIGREIQASCERYSQAGARARRDAVRFMRDEEGMTQDQIAAAIGISRPRVSELLR